MEIELGGTGGQLGNSPKQPYPSGNILYIKD